VRPNRERNDEDAGQHCWETVRGVLHRQKAVHFKTAAIGSTRRALLSCSFILPMIRFLGLVRDWFRSGIQCAIRAQSAERRLDPIVK
jgi:hypothetical protein